jgi:LDH2 family malate/lactate/ureidoglycolate dehydrogenase
MPDRPVDADALLALTSEVFRRVGMDEADAGCLAHHLVTADLRGVHSHGVLRVPEYVGRLTREGFDPRGRPRVVRDEGACLVVDGGNSMGQIGARFAMSRAIERAATTGVAAVAVRGSNHCGALAYYAAMALPHDMIGIATTDCVPVMAPWGGVERLLGISPLAVAIPAGEERPIVYDGAFSASSVGKVMVYQQKGLQLPEGWALDSEGNATTDPAAALVGLMAPIGAYKGAALAMIMAMLSTLLSGAAFGTELGTVETGPRAGRNGHFLMALRVGAFEDVARFKARVDGVIRQLRGSRLAPGFDRIYLPGERSALTEEAYRREGIPLNPATRANLRDVAASLGLEDAAAACLS